MYDILKDIWKNPGARYSPYPVWLWNGELDVDKLVIQLDAFHKKGIDGVIIRPWLGMSGVDYLSAEFFEIMKSVLEAAKNRRMAVVISDDFSAVYDDAVKSDVRLGERILYAQPTGGEISDGGEILYRLHIKLEDGLLMDVRLGPNVGYTPYDFILGYAPHGADLLNSAVSEKLLKLTYEKYYSALHEYFGSVIIGFYLTPGKMSENEISRGGMNHSGIRWSCEINNDWIETGEDFISLASLLFEPKIKKIRREGEFIYNNIFRSRINSSYLAPLSKWCREHGVGLIGGISGDSGDVAYSENFDVPASVVSRVGGEISEEYLASVKRASDMARHIGISHSAVELRSEADGKPLTPDDFMCEVNSAFTHGASMMMPCAFNYSDNTDYTLTDMGQGSSWWSEYRRAAGYIKRMSWLNGTGTNNPCCAVLCSPEYTPVRPVRELYERGYAFNYLSIDDLMTKAHVHEDEIHIDRYVYNIMLVDSRLRLNAETVTKIGQFVTAGGYLYRGNDFVSFVEKHVKRKSYFIPDDDSKSRRSIRFLHLTKSGCPFFIMLNEGIEEVNGHFVTDIGCLAEIFDAFTGKTEPVSAELTERGFEYALNIPAHSAVVIGIDPASLVNLKKESDKKYCLTELSAHSGDQFSFDVRKSTEKVVLSASDIPCVVGVKINGNDAEKFVFKPYEIDITKYVYEGENTAELTFESPASLSVDLCKNVCGGCAVKLNKSS